VAFVFPREKFRVIEMKRLACMGELLEEIVVD
jgi:hypothetical protein